MLWREKKAIRSAGRMLSVHLSLFCMRVISGSESLPAHSWKHTQRYTCYQIDRQLAQLEAKPILVQVTCISDYMSYIRVGLGMFGMAGLFFNAREKKKHQVVLLFGLRLMVCCIIWLRRSHLSGKTQFQQNKIKGKIPGNDTVCLSRCLPLL